MSSYVDLSSASASILTDIDRGAELLSRLRERLQLEESAIREFAIQAHQANAPQVLTTSKYLIVDRWNRPSSVVICSAPEEPDVVSRAVEASQAARRSLGPLGDVVLSPLAWGEISGLSYAVYPFCKDLTKSRYVWVLQRAWLRPRLLRWLRESTQATIHVPTSEEIERDFIAPLSDLHRLRGLPEQVRDSARFALDRLRAGTWSPRHCLMHGDIWKGNLMLAPGSRGWSRFALIDWASSLIQGYGMFDLVSISRSLKLRGEGLRAEVENHCRILGCEFADARSHLACALAYIESHRGNFPWERYLDLATRSLQLLDTIGG